MATSRIGMATKYLTKCVAAKRSRIGILLLKLLGYYIAFSKAIYCPY
jgi:hypothetical protein